MTPKEIFVHCTATRPDWWKSRSTGQKVAEIKRWHLDRGWSDIGYHFLIDRNGNVAKGRPETKQGAHARGHNRDTLAISLFGGHGSSETDEFSDNFTAEQEDALLGLIADLMEKYPTIQRVRGHNEVAAKACPGFTVADLWADAHETPVSPPAPRSGALAAILKAILSIFGKTPNPPPKG